MPKGLARRRKFWLLSLLIPPALSAQESAWQDSSKHRIQFVPVENDVRLEVLDWGGSGKPMVLLAGSGNTAHVFDGFAEKLTRLAHVYGITRRGFGASSHPEAGYTDQRLSDDVLHVLDLLKLDTPVLVGHSMGGNELTTLASQHPRRVSGLVYMDAGFDPKDFPSNDPEYADLAANLPPDLLPRLPSLPASERYAVRGQNSRHAVSAIAEGTKKRDYSKIRVPVLSLFATPRPADDPLRMDMPTDPDLRAALEKFEAITMSYIKKYESSLRQAIPGARIVELPGANHYVFLSNEADVLRETIRFISRLPSRN
jgi:pimeloyl-ACP methyl ester carboxylesterase